MRNSKRPNPCGEGDWFIEEQVHYFERTLSTDFQ